MKTETKFTPAPWIISDDNSWECAVLTSKEEHWIEVKNTDMAESGFFEMQANAKLIAAAPCLLEALIKINGLIADVSNIENSKINLGELAKISINAIKKATL